MLSSVTSVPHRRAFTLIEILVVIGIIGVLAGILFPVFAQARAKARQTACLSNLKQIGTAFTLYRQDYDERFPIAVDDSKEHSVTLWHSSQVQVHDALRNAPLLQTVMQPYLKTPEIWHCPDDTGGINIRFRLADANDSYETPENNSFYEAFGNSYHYRAELGFLSGPVETVPAIDFGNRSLSISEVYLLSDSHGWHMAKHPNAVQNYFLETDYAAQAGKCNTLFADGHAKALPQHDLSILQLGNLDVE